MLNISTIANLSKCVIGQTNGSFFLKQFFVEQAIEGKKNLLNNFCVVQVIEKSKSAPVYESDWIKVSCMKTEGFSTDRQLFVCDHNNIYMTRYVTFKLFFTIFPLKQIHNKSSLSLIVKIKYV